MKKKIIGLLILLLIYVIAFFVGFGTYFLTSKVIGDIILNLLIADVVATIFIWIVGLILKTASIYDPYWSIQTVAIYVPLQIMYGFNLGNIIFLIFLSLWAIRLTYNFIKTSGTAKRSGKSRISILSFYYITILTHSNLHHTFKQENSHLHTCHLQNLQN